MGAIAAAPAFDALAFAFAAIAFALIAYTLIINPLRSGADASSGLPVIGGALAWVLSNIANLIESSVYWVNSMKGIAYAQAAGWWNWIVTMTIGNYYGDVNGKFADLYWRSSVLWSQVYGVLAYQIGDLYSRVYNISNVAYSALDLARITAYAQIPQLRGDISALARQVSTFETDISNLRYIVLGTLSARVGALEADVIDFGRWREWLGSQVLPRMQQDINVRAFESETEALRQQLRQAQRQISVLFPLALLAVAGTEAISNLRCHMDVPCDPLSQLAQGDVIDRLNNLEIGEG